MISETALLDCEDVPACMSERFDQPWHFVGEVEPKHYSLNAVCMRCADRPIRLKEQIRVEEIIYQIVPMQSYLFITDDMIEVTIYFGVCDKCDRVYWARQGPPFTRARCFATA